MAATFNLIIEDDAGKQIVVPFARDVITIGRKEGNTIRLTERNVSRFHAKLSRESGHVLVEDLTSFNGVKLNGDRIAGRVQVAAGDVIEIGDYHLELRSAQPQPSAAALATTARLGPAGARSAAVGDAGAGGDDDFEGDTQRWEPPTGGAIPVGTARTAEAPVLNQFGESSGDTERLDMSKFQGLSAQAWPPPKPTMPSLSASASESEPTARQPIAHVPVGAMAPLPPSFSPSLGAPLAAPPAFVSAPTLEPLSDETQDMPAIAPLPSTPAAVSSSPPPPSRPPPRAEQTEQMRAVPSSHPGDDLSVPRLVVLNTVFAGSAFQLRAAEAVLGRTDDNDIVLEHRSVSRNHCKLVREGDRVRILDLKSANGILVNNEEVEQQVLRSGDVIELGKVRIRFVPIGERFVVPADEIDRARIADTVGNDFDDNANPPNVTSPMRQLSVAPTPAAPPKPIALYALVAVLAVVVVVLAAVVLTRGGDTDPPPPPPTVALNQPAPPPADPPPAPVAAPVPAPAPAPQPAPAPVPEPAPAPAPVMDLQLDEPDQAPPTGTRKTDKKKFDPVKSADEAKALMVRGEYAQAVTHLKAIVEKNNSDARAHLQLGICYAQLRKNVLARAHYQRFLELSPTGPDAERVRKSLEAL